MVATTRRQISRHAADSGHRLCTGAATGETWSNGRGLRSAANAYSRRGGPETPLWPAAVHPAGPASPPEWPRGGLRHLQGYLGGGVEFPDPSAVADFDHRDAFVEVQPASLRRTGHPGDRLVTRPQGDGVV